MRKLTQVILFSLIASIPISSAHGEQPRLVRLAFTSGWDALPVIVGIERGFFHAENLEVSGLTTTNPTALMSSISAGSTDFAAVPQRSLLIMAAAKLPIKVVGKNGWGTEIELLTRAGNESISGVADLKGKSVAVGPGSEAYPVLVRLLNAAGLRPADVDIRFLDPDSLVSVFDKNLADTIFETRYYTSAIMSSGKAKVVLSNENISGKLGLIDARALVANGKVVSEDPETVQRFLNAWIKALVYIQQDPADAASLLRLFFHRQGTLVSPKLAQAWITFTHFDRYTWTEDDILDAEYNGWGLVEGQILKVSPKLDGLIENKFAEKAWAVLQTQ